MVGSLGSAGPLRSAHQDGRLCAQARSGVTRSRSRPARPSTPDRRPTFERFLTSRFSWVTGGLVALHVALCVALFDPKIHTGGDSVTYVLLAESVLEAGDGYSLSLEPGPPEAHTKYPPGFPILLAPLVAAFGRNFVVLKLMSMAFTAGAVLVFCVYARRGRDPVPWLCLALAFAVSPGVIDYSRWMLSEAPFLFFTLAALWLLREDEETDAIGTTFWLALAASIAGFYMRSIGALLLAGASLSYLLRREWRKFVVHGVVGAGLTIPWLVRNQLVTGSTTPYLEEFLLENVYAPEAGQLDFAGMVGRFVTNGWLYATRELPRTLVGSDSGWSGNLLVVSIAVAVCLMALVGLVRGLRGRPNAAGLYLILTCAAIMLFQTSVNDVRYLVPLIPLILVYGAEGAGALSRRVARLGGRVAGLTARARHLPACAMGLLAALALGAHAARIPGNLEMIATYNAGDRYAGYASAWRNFFEAARWIEENTPPDAVVTVRKPRLFNAVADRRVRLYPYSTNADSVLGVVGETDLVLIDALFPTTRMYLLPALQQQPDDFFVAHQTDPPVTWVLGVT
ncbi:MAG: hypothetical protein F4106_05220, partial [Gemmatimonadetes bacterium]|nr:hypothetical protein [Gemmatimonadota bacterium]MYJ17437.1 hypothetical protein [Gemmatimonadota bacterium]